jgi:aspartyl protease family protein
MAAFILLPTKVGEIIGSVLATLAFDGGVAPQTVPGPIAQCNGPSPVFAAMVQTQSTQPSAPIPAKPGAHSINRAADGLFYIDAIVNGARVRFLIDTGATTIVLTKGDAMRAGVLPHAARFDETANTAGGETRMARVRLARLTVGRSIDFDVPAAVANDGLGVSLLGASWLTQIASLTIAGDRMVLQ